MHAVSMTKTRLACYASSPFSCCWLNGKLRMLHFARDTSVQTFEALLRLTQIPGIFYRFTSGIRVVGFQAEVNAKLVTSRLVDDLALCLHGKLDVVAISSLHQPRALDLADGEGGNQACFLALWVGPNQTQ